MSKKIIAILTIATLLFVGVFAACDKNGSDSDDTLYVTDENGERVLDENGRFVVYETNAEGEIVTDKSGEDVTDVQIFEPVLEDGVLEDYGFKLTIPEGWKQSEEEKNVFVKKNMTVEIRVVKKTYDEYLSVSKSFYETIFEKGVEGSIEESKDLVKGAEQACRLVMYIEDELWIGTAFSINGNLYDVALKGPKDEVDVAYAEAFLNGFEFKPFTYYPELTAESTEENAEETDTEATTK